MTQAIYGVKHTCCDAGRGQPTAGQRPGSTFCYEGRPSRGLHCHQRGLDLLVLPAPRARDPRAGCLSWPRSSPATVPRQVCPHLDPMPWRVCGVFSFPATLNFGLLRNTFLFPIYFCLMKNQCMFCVSCVPPG